MSWTHMVSVRGELRKTKAFEHALVGDSLHDGPHGEFTVSDNVVPEQSDEKVHSRFYIASPPCPCAVSVSRISRVVASDSRNRDRRYRCSPEARHDRSHSQPPHCCGPSIECDCA